jgi:predicted amidohydrolase YtcJ
MAHTPQYGHGSPLQSLLESSVRIALAPDGLMNPFVNLKIITSEQSNPGENLTREQAVMAYTIGGAYAEFLEVKKGSLTGGKIADLAMLSQDIFTISNEQLPATKSVLTIIDGKIVYKQW